MSRYVLLLGLFIITSSFVSAKETDSSASELDLALGEAKCVVIAEYLELPKSMIDVHKNRANILSPYQYGFMRGYESSNADSMLKRIGKELSSAVWTDFYVKKCRLSKE